MKVGVAAEKGSEFLKIAETFNIRLEGIEALLPHKLKLF